MLTSPSGKYYIGQTKSTSEKRFKGHICDSNAANGGTCRMLNNALRKYSPDAFKLEILLKCNTEQLDHYETKFIELYNSNNSEYGYNLRSGGNLSNLAESTKKLMSINRQLKPCFCKPHSEKTKNKIKETLLNKVTRKSHEDEELPKHMKYIKWSDREGYAIVNHPQYKVKYFVSKKLNNEEKFKQCIDFLTSKP